MIVIIPAGGLGVRFTDQGFIEPKPLIRALGKTIISWLLHHLEFEDSDICLIIANKKLQAFGFDQEIATVNASKRNITVHYLHQETKGATETVLLGLKQVPVECMREGLAVIDSDAFFTKDVLSMGRKSTIKNGIVCFEDTTDVPIGGPSSFSHVLTDDKNIISDIKEKVKLSTLASCGCYFFESCISFKKYASIANESMDGESYISKVFAIMLGEKISCIAHVIDPNDFHCLGTPLQLLSFTNNIPRVAASDFAGIKPIFITPQRFCFDLDGSLVTLPVVDGDYSTVLPISKNIQVLKYLKRLGHYIIIHTARRMRTHEGNVGKVMQDIGEVTFKTLAKFGICYDEIVFGKPHADFYIDDKAISAHFDLEKSLGFYHSTIKARKFNDLQSGSISTFVKRSADEKLLGEIHWFQTMPEEIKDLFPLFIRSGENNTPPFWYEMEKIPGVEVSNLWLAGMLTDTTLRHILSSLNRIHSCKVEESIPEEEVASFYSNKLHQRYDTFDCSQYGDAELLFTELMNYFSDPDQGIKVGYIHGDPVFTNIIVNRYGKLKFIDMRGMVNSSFTKCGDIFYDYAKILQSLVGYDEILLNRTVDECYRKIILQTFEGYVTEIFGEIVLNHIRMITKSLLLSLLPLHANENCTKFLSLATDL
ncbi:hypothetical protein M9434_001295 [Picochlorum sp. BPE23]|nr:hypothetical protein M9434_001295 [Picochlorum sp. BPE23]